MWEVRLRGCTLLGPEADKRVLGGRRLKRLWGSHLGAHFGHKVQAVAGGVDFQAL